MEINLGPIPNFSVLRPLGICVFIPNYFDGKVPSWFNSVMISFADLCIFMLFCFPEHTACLLGRRWICDF